MNPNSRNETNCPDQEWRSRNGCWLFLLSALLSSFAYWPRWWTRMSVVFSFKWNKTLWMRYIHYEGTGWWGGVGWEGTMIIRSACYWMYCTQIAQLIFRNETKGRHMTMDRHRTSTSASPIPPPPPPSELMDGSPDVKPASSLFLHRLFCCPSVLFIYMYMRSVFL